MKLSIWAVLNGCISACLCTIGHRHFRTSIKGILSCFIHSLMFYCIRISLYYVEECILREIDWASVIICNWYSIHSSPQSHIHNKTLVWMSAEESDIFVVLSFHHVIPDDSATQCICWLRLARCFVKITSLFTALFQTRNYCCLSRMQLYPWTYSILTLHQSIVLYSTYWLYITVQL